jgi:hypothetical protein
MLQFNQTKHALKWRMSGHTFTCEPWGSIDLEPWQAEACKRRGLPLGPAPVDPEVRATRRLAEEQEEASKGAFQALKREADEAKGAARASKEQLDATLVELDTERGKTRLLRDKVAKCEQRISELEADAKAAEQLIQETAKAAAQSEERAIKAEAVKKKPGKAE